MQELADDLYEEFGLTDEVLDLQLKINKLRHEQDISDDKQKVYKNWVQQVDVMTLKDTLNKVQLRNIKRAKLKQLECELDLQIKQDADKETITETKTRITKLKQELQKINVK